MTRIEKGATGTAIGIVMEAAVLCGVPLFDVERPDRVRRFASIADRAAVALALLPRRVRPAEITIDNDF